MKNLLLAANWKSNKTKNEAKAWLEDVGRNEFDQLEIIIFPPFTLLDFASSFVKERSLPFKIGAQDVSLFEKGPYTGEVNASQIKEFADFVLIGHSERRVNFSETDELINQKIEKANSQQLIPVVCVSNLSQIERLKFDKELIIAFEPISAIGTGNPEDPSEVNSIAMKIKSALNSKVIYGGSIDANNIKNYLELDNISGALVGGASLDPLSFTNIIKNAL